MLTTPLLLAASMRTWFLMIASSSLIRASMKPCSFLAAWYSKFSERSPNSRAALILATMAGRRTVTSWSSSWRTLASPSGVMWTSFVTGRVYPPHFMGEAPPHRGAEIRKVRGRRKIDLRGYGRGRCRIQSPHDKADADRGHGAHGSGPCRRLRACTVRGTAVPARPGDRDSRVGGCRGPGHRPHGG